jgi:hypothetical protein
MGDLSHFPSSLGSKKLVLHQPLLGGGVKWRDNEKGSER